MNGGGGGAPRAGHARNSAEAWRLFHLSRLGGGERKMRDLKLDFTGGETDATGS
jgi:hypothetical protein